MRKYEGRIRRFYRTARLERQPRKTSHESRHLSMTLRTGHQRGFYGLEGRNRRAVAGAPRTERLPARRHCGETARSCSSSGPKHRDRRLKRICCVNLNAAPRGLRRGGSGGGRFYCSGSRDGARLLVSCQALRTCVRNPSLRFGMKRCSIGNVKPERLADVTRRSLRPRCVAFRLYTTTAS